MKKQKQSLLIHAWKEFEFYLYIPDEVNRDSKPFLFYYYQDPKTGKAIRIRKFIGQNKGDKKLIQKEAKEAVLDLVTLLDGNFNPLTKCYNELTISPLSPIKDCLSHWLSTNESAFTNKAIGWKRLKNLRIIAMHFTDYLSKKNLLHQKASVITSIHVKDFLDSKAYERQWGKVTYNCYRVDISTFFNYLADLKIVSMNPVEKTAKKVTKFDSSRFKVYELDELVEVANLLANDPSFSGLYVASKFLFKYNIRPIEISRIQVKDINWETNLMILDSTKTKNGNEARFLLDEDMMGRLKSLTTEYDPELFIFGGRNKQSASKTCEDYFGQRWRLFRKKYHLPQHLKFYALKHTSNYYDIENGASYEEIRQRNRHANLQITTLYIKERLFKNIIKASSSTTF